MRFACLISDSFEDIEALGTVALLRRADIQVDLISVSNQPIVKGYYQIAVQANKLMKQLKSADYDGLLIPGGKHAWTLREDPAVLRVIREFHEADKWIMAICAAPTVLGKAGIMAGRHYVSYPGTDQDIEGGIYLNKMTVTDGKIITAIGVGAVLDFALEIIEQVLGKDKRDRMQRNIRYKAFETEK